MAAFAFQMSLSVQWGGDEGYGTWPVKHFGSDIVRLRETRPDHKASLEKKGENMGIFSDALNALSTSWRVVITACLLPFVLSALIELLPLPDGVFILGVVAIVQIALYTCIAVAVHRIVLIGPDSIPPYGVMMSMSRRELRFAGALLLFACLIVALMLLMKLPIVFSFVVLGAVLYGIPVFSIVFPAVAVDSELTLRELVGVGRHHYWLLAKATLIVPLAFGIFGSAVGEVVAKTSAPQFLLDLAGQAGAALALVVEIAVLSIAYREIEVRESPLGVFES